MEMEYKDTNRRGKFVIIVGVVLAVVAGGAAFYLIQQAQQTAGQGEATLVDVVVAAQNIPARTPILPGAVEKKKARIVYPRLYGVALWFPRFSRWISARLAFHANSIFGFRRARSCMIFDARSVSRR